MFIEFIDLLRCPRPHADSWLVAAFEKMDGRFVMAGKLGCPVCSSNYTISAGVADLRSDAGSQAPAFDLHRFAADSSDHRIEEDSVRAAALMGLTNPNALVVLAGGSANLGRRVSELAEARVIALNPAPAVQETERLAVVLMDSRFPLAPFSVDGMVLDGSAGPALFADAGRVLRQGGRLVAPADAALGAGFRVLARDDLQVVAESVGQLVSISR